VVIELTEDVALVLFDALTRAKSEDDQRRLVLEHPAERTALWMLEGQLERGWSLRFELTTGMRLQRRVAASRRPADPGEAVVRLVDSGRGARRQGFREL
jgi:hypothetical protein